MILGGQVESHQSKYAKISEFVKQKDGMAEKFRLRTEEISPDLISTNLGRLGLPADVPGIDVERVFFAPGASLTMELAIGLATTNDRLTITLNYYKGFADGEAIRKIRDRADEIIRELIQA